MSWIQFFFRKRTELAGLRCLADLAGAENGDDRKQRQRLPDGSKMGRSGNHGGNRTMKIRMIYPNFRPQ